ncbi:MAG: histidine kinase dimerization/phospho-acceptor domain-containing protein, partial [Candidatus Limnocylindria bacterium]
MGISGPGVPAAVGDGSLTVFAHELRAPLAALAASSELLALGAGEWDAGAVRSAATTIHRRSLWLQGLVENLLCAATIAEGRLALRPRRVDLDEAVRDAARL